jgi:PPOX class probable F420-dependent enzyme
MNMSERLARASDRFFDRMRSARSADAAEAVPSGGLDDLRGRKYCVLVTYKKSGEPVPSPLWFGTGNGKLYFQTGATVAKVKRIERNPEVRVAPASSRGRPLGPPFVGTARVLAAQEEAEAERCVQANYGLGRRMYTRFGGGVTNVYVEVTPASAPGA